eukprot:gnl/Dysnectes_brevis/2877_a3515_1365.p1 GENE.gnl/Dysnectes_brevis/2877_a3515_1365~~gnl/Dysnectes_brevis/2877_a3515_1365.p1  ORF type:complete len:408 (+),score=38.32 gnl/Dysnectes_brevis/2877_a3515_1365:23-1246(+)
MGRRRLTLPVYLARHPRFHEFLIRHIRLTSSEMEMLLMKRQRSFCSEYKWYRRLYPSLEDSIQALEKLPDILNELRRIGIQDPVPQNPIECNCKLCLRRAVPEVNEPSSVPDTPLIEESISPATAGFLVTSSSFIHDSLCLKSCSEHLLCKVFKYTPSGSFTPPSQVQAPSPSAILEHATTLMGCLSKLLSSRDLERRILERCSIVIDALGEPSNFQDTLSYGSITHWQVHPLPLLDTPFIDSHQPAGVSTQRPPFPLARPEDLVGGHPIATWDPLPVVHGVALLKAVSRRLSSHRSKHPLRSVGTIARELRRVGVLELMVAISTVTQGGMVPIPANLIPSHVRLHSMVDPHHLCKLWKQRGFTWVDHLNSSLGLEDISIDLFRRLQMLQVESLCTWLLSSTPAQTY